ncbi:MAG: hypothetical protein AAFP76_16860 [Bacteroidota bacterium]
MTQEQLQVLFTKDKTNWYQKTKNNIRIWDNAKVHQFWEMVRIHKIQKGDFNFNGFVFPSFAKSEEKKLQLGDNQFVLSFVKRT